MCQCLCHGLVQPPVSATSLTDALWLPGWQVVMILGEEPVHTPQGREVQPILAN